MHDSPQFGPQHGAVFLSYASQDAGDARRICDALRAEGIEVWFDQSELRGGDAWDQKIRGQIRECALFVPIVSSNTQARLEGYFRVEWKLAAQRTHAMGWRVISGGNGSSRPSAPMRWAGGLFPGGMEARGPAHPCDGGREALFAAPCDR